MVLFWGTDNSTYSTTCCLFVYIGQLFCHCEFIYSNVHWQLVSLLRDGSLYCFCVLAESYETITKSSNQCQGHLSMSCRRAAQHIAKIKFVCFVKFTANF